MLNSKLNFALVFTILAVAAAPLFGQNSPPAVKEQEIKLIAVLKSEANQKDKADACRQLGRIGTKDAVPALAALLGDDKLSHMARYGLETIPDPAVDAALRDALGTLKGRLLAGVISSLGVRQDVKAVEPLAKYLTDTDADVAQAAARALGKIGTSTAAKAIDAAFASTPPANQVAFYEGLFRCGEALATQGQRTEAIAIYDRLRALPGAPQQVRAGALRGAVLTRQKDGLPILLEGVRSSDFVLVDAAARTALEMPGRETTQALADELAKLPADKQILLTQTLGKRADAAALPALFAAAKTGDNNVRVAAIRALPEIGQATAVPVLVALLGDGDRAIAQAAQEALAGFPGKEADAAIVAMLGSSDVNQRLTGIELTGRRRMVACIPALLKAAEDADAKVRPAAYKRLGELAGVNELPALLGLLTRSQPPQDLSACEQALTAVCARINNPAACTDKLAGLLAQAQPAPKGVLLRVLSTVGGEKALKAVCGAVADANADVHGAAIRALSAWKTVDAAPELLTQAKAAKNPTDKMICLRGYLDWASQPDLPAAQRLTMCQKAAELIQSNDEKKLLLGALGSITTVESVALIVPYLNDAATKEEASAATVTIAEKLLKEKEAAALAPKLIEPLQKAAQATGNADLANRAKAQLQQAQNKAAGK